MDESSEHVSTLNYSYGLANHSIVFHLVCTIIILCMNLLIRYPSRFQPVRPLQQSLSSSATYTYPAAFDSFLPLSPLTTTAHQSDVSKEQAKGPSITITYSLQESRCSWQQPLLSLSPKNRDSHKCLRPTPCTSRHQPNRSTC